MGTTYLTTAQALVRFLANQFSERDGDEARLITGLWGIFGHGNVAGLGQALHEYGDTYGMPFFRPQNEQGQVHAAVAYARHRRRRATMACTASIGPGSTNMVTGAALATINRLPVLLLPSDYFANRTPDPVLQQLEHPSEHDVSVNDAFRPVSRFFSRISRPAQLLHALPEAMRILADPADTGAVTLSLPEDVQAEAFEWPETFFDRRVWHIRRPPPEPGRVAQAVELLARARSPLVVVGGGVKYAEAEAALAAFVDSFGIPFVETQAGKGALPWDHPMNLGPVGATGGSAGNQAAAEADVVLAVGTRLADFTTASRTAFAADAAVIGLNVTAVDASKLRGLPVTADARSGLKALHAACGERGMPKADEGRRRRIDTSKRRWDGTVASFRADEGAVALSQARAIGLTNDIFGETATVICAAGSMPGDLHKLWRARDSSAYHVEYGYSCMGYEIPAGIGVALAEPEREVVVMIGDGSYLMMNSELVTAVAEGLDLTVVLVDNHGYQSIHGLQRHVGTPHFGLELRRRDTTTGRLDGPYLPVDYARHAEAMGATTWHASDANALEGALRAARAARGVRVVVVEVHPEARLPEHDHAGWWDVPVAEASRLDSVRQARESYEAERKRRRRSR